MRYLINYLIAFSISLCSFAQRAEIDSLKTQLQVSLTDSSKVDLLNQIAYKYQDVNGDSALIYVNEAFRLADSLDYKKGLAASYARKGSIYFGMANDDLALESYLASLELSHEINDSVNLSVVYHGLGIMYDILDQENKAVEMLETALEIAKRKSLDIRRIRILLSLSIVNQNMNNPDAAFLYVKNALKLSEEIDYDEGIIITSNFLARLFRNQNDLDMALVFLNKAYKMAKKIGNNARTNHALVGIGEIHTLKGQYTEARIALNEAVEVVENTNLLSYEQDAYEKLYVLDTTIGDYHSALKNYMKNVAILDSIDNVATTNQMSELITKYETEKKEKEIQLQEQQIAVLEKDQQIDNLWRNILIVGILLIIGAALSVIYFQREKNANEKKLLSQKIEFQGKELTSYTVNFIQKRNVLDEIEQNLLEVEKLLDGDTKLKVRKARKLVSRDESIDRDWEEFKLYFETVHTNFFHALKKKHPNVNGTDLKLCSLIKLNMNTKEMSSVLGISPESVKTSRYRLRKKLGLETKDNLHDYILKVEKSVT